MKLLRDIDVAGKRVFVRADLDVLISNFKSGDLSIRLQNLKPTVDWLLGHRTKQVVIAGHIDRPEGPDPKLSTKNLVDSLQKILEKEITFQPVILSGSEGSKGDSIGPSVLQNDKKIVLLENLRFWPGEEANDLEFAKQLALMADVYINEAFGNSHRVHASMVGVPALLPHAAGLHLQKEIEVLGSILKNPQRPFVAIVGGAKIETKLPVIANLAKSADFVLVGGAIAKEMIIVQSNVIKATLTPDTKDISIATIEQFTKVIKDAKTIVWNGPMGVFEEGFDSGTKVVAEAIIKNAAYSVVGGGDTTEFLGKLGILDKFGFVSSGGGAMLEFLAGKELPGIKVLE